MLAPLDLAAVAALETVVTTILAEVEAQILAAEAVAQGIWVAVVLRLEAEGLVSLLFVIYFSRRATSWHIMH